MMHGFSYRAGSSPTDFRCNESYLRVSCGCGVVCGGVVTSVDPSLLIVARYKDK